MCGSSSACRRELRPPSVGGASSSGSSAAAGKGVGSRKAEAMRAEKASTSCRGVPAADHPSSLLPRAALSDRSLGTSAPTDDESVLCVAADRALRSRLCILLLGLGYCGAASREWPGLGRPQRHSGSAICGRARLGARFGPSVAGKGGGLPRTVLVTRQRLPQFLPGSTTDVPPHARTIDLKAHPRCLRARDDR